MFTLTMSQSTVQDPQTCTDCDKIPPMQSEGSPSGGQGTTMSTSAIQPQASGSAAPAETPQPDPTTFIPPSPQSQRPSITIEFCDRCRWAPRASWIQTELFLTFPLPIIRSITLQPLTAPETGGRFRVWVYLDDTNVTCVWDRKSEGGFPELKVLKQRIRNLLQPDLNLGHSDVVKPDRSKSDQPTAVPSTEAPGAVSGAGGTNKDMPSFPVNSPAQHPGLVFMKGTEQPSEAHRAFKDWALRF